MRPYPLGQYANISLINRRKWPRSWNQDSVVLALEKANTLGTEVDWPIHIRGQATIIHCEGKGFGLWFPEIDFFRGSIYSLDI
jgi:hypothetical protein